MSTGYTKLSLIGELPEQIQVLCDPAKSSPCLTFLKIMREQLKSDFVGTASLGLPNDLVQSPLVIEHVMRQLEPSEKDRFTRLRQARRELLGAVPMRHFITDTTLALLPPTQRREQLHYFLAEPRVLPEAWEIRHVPTPSLTRIGAGNNFTIARSKETKGYAAYQEAVAVHGDPPVEVGLPADSYFPAGSPEAVLRVTRFALLGDFAMSAEASRARWQTLLGR